MLGRRTTELKLLEHRNAGKEHQIFDADIAQSGTDRNRELRTAELGGDQIEAEVEGGEGRRHHQHGEHLRGRSAHCLIHCIDFVGHLIDGFGLRFQV